MRRLGLLVGLMVLLGLAGLPSKVESGCQLGSLYCSTDPACIPIPTSIPPCGLETDVGYSPSSTNPSRCGTKTCGVIFRCPCGKFLCNDICGA